MTVDLAAITAVCCLGIGACGYLIGRLHARARGCPHPHWDITRISELIDDWTFPQPPKLDPMAELTAVHVAEVRRAMDDTP